MASGEREGTFSPPYRKLRKERSSLVARCSSLGERARFFFVVPEARQGWESNLKTD